MTAVVVLAALAAWFLLSLLTAGVCTAVIRGGLEEDRVRALATHSGRTLLPVD